MASTECENIVIFKSVSESDNQDDAYYRTFHSTGYNVTLIPVLDFEFINLEELLCKMKNPNDYTGIIFSSPRCVRAVALCLQNCDSEAVLGNWKNSTNFVVGQKTGEVAQALGFSVCGKEAGNGDALAEIICKGTYKKPFLYPVGSLSTKSFQSKLRQNSVELDEILIYNTKQHPQLEKNISVTNYFKKLGTIVVYFSPSGVEFTLPLLRTLEIDLNTLKFVAIGPATETTIRNNGLKVFATSTAPNPESLLDAVKSLNKSSPI